MDDFFEAKTCLWTPTSSVARTRSPASMTAEAPPPAGRFAGVLGVSAAQLGAVVRDTVRGTRRFDALSIACWLTLGVFVSLAIVLGVGVGVALTGW